MRKAEMQKFGSLEDGRGRLRNQKLASRQEEEKIEAEDKKQRKIPDEPE
jgi:hypothetical protein